MKRTISLLLAVMMCVSLMAGCAQKQQPPEATTQPAQTAAPTTEETTAPPETTAAPTEATEETEPQRIHLRFSELEMTALNETCRLYNGTVPVSEVSFGSGDESIVTFHKGIAVSHGEGTAVVFAEYAGEKLECTVTCVLPTEAPTEATEDPEKTEPEEPEYTEPSYGGSRDPVMAPPSSFNVDSSFFDDACFIGDSVSVMLSWYAEESGTLGNAKFLVKGSYSAVNASYNYMTMEYDGVSYDYIEDAVAATGSSKCFIMLGTNDIGYMTIGDTIANWKDIIGRIQAKCPGIQIYIQSGTPIYTEGQTGSLNNENMDKLNERLRELAGEYGLRYLNIAQYLKDDTNGLAPCYCSDEYVHLTYSGASVWVKALKSLV